MKAAVSVILLFFCSLAGAGVAPVNSNSKVIDGIEFYIQTDKAVYTLGENVEMLYKVTNLNNHNVNFEFGQSPEHNFWVEYGGLNIWQRYGLTRLPVIVWFTLEPGASKIYPLNPPYIWDMKDNSEILVTIGEYQVIGGFDAVGPNGSYEYSKVSVPITVVPEPATMLLLGLGWIFIKKRR